VHFEDAERIGVYGRSGSGKTTWMKNYIRGKSRIVVFDPMDEYFEMATRIEHTSAGSIEEVRAAMVANPNGYKIAFVPAGGQEAAALNAISSLLWRGMAGYRTARLAWEKTGHKIPKGSRAAPKIYLVVEEMNLSFKLHGGADRVPAFADICSRGRRSGIEVAGCSQRVAEVSKRFRGNLSQVAVFAQGDTGDRKAAAEALFVPSKELEDLKPFEYIYRETNTVSRQKLKPKKN